MSSTSDYTSTSESSDSETEDVLTPNGRIRVHFGYNQPDDGGPAPNAFRFRPESVGVNLRRLTRRGVHTMTRALDFFMLFFTVEVIGRICEYTNLYGHHNVITNPNYGEADGSWSELTPDELYKFIGLLIFMGLVRLPNYDSYWSVQSLYSGCWARSFIPSRQRFKALMAFLKTSHPDHEDMENRLSKVEELYIHMKQICKQYFQPGQNVSVDERTVAAKGGVPMRQFMRDKPKRFGIKLWVLADAATGYTFEFDICLGKRGTNTSRNGLGYDVVMGLCRDLYNNGYHVYFDNFYTSPVLLHDLKERGVLACGTITKNGRGFPACMKDVRWERTAERGSMRWYRDENNMLTLQWKDNRAVCIMSTIHTASEHTTVQRRTKSREGMFQRIEVNQPVAIRDYNKYMRGVHLSNQLTGTYTVAHKSTKWWKKLFFHFIDIAVVNSFILFRQFREEFQNMMN
ncbi:piggyBac transposable element-derived protein 4-like [Ptychodera flava]|uniref:piggyBac transposable element-derived protein 4-like n=1 Tax=Ptychodera flava TaxID=63121 RepID=UPI003969CAC0